MRSELREMRTQKRRMQIAIIATGAILSALAVLLFDGLMSP